MIWLLHFAHFLNPSVNLVYKYIYSIYTCQYIYIYVNIYIIIDTRLTDGLILEDGIYIYIYTYKPNYHSDVPCFCWLSHVPIVVGETPVFLVEQKGCWVESEWYKVRYPVSEVAKLVQSSLSSRVYGRYIELVNGFKISFSEFPFL